MARENTKRASIRDRARQRAEENKFVGGSSYIRLPEGVEFFKPEKGNNELDIIPFEMTATKSIPDGKNGSLDLQKGDLWSCRTIYVHRNIGSEEKSYICPRTVKKPCPICEARAALMKSANATDEEIDALKYQVKDLFNVIDLTSKEKEIQILEFSHYNFRDIS